MTGSFDGWLGAVMTARGIRSARRLALEAGLEPELVADWLIGQSVPSDEECATLARYLGLSAAEVAERRFPTRRPSGEA